jgi:hypothetical protein
MKSPRRSFRHSWALSARLRPGWASRQIANAGKRGSAPPSNLTRLDGLRCEGSIIAIVNILIRRFPIDLRTRHLARSFAMAERPAGELVVWIIDQFEKVFTICRNKQERKQFLDNVLYAVSIPYGRSTVVLTMRADFYPKCAAYSELSARIAVAGQQYLVSPMDFEG